MTQETAILSYLEENENITSLDAFKKFGATRLSAIIYNLRHNGYKIRSQYETTTNRLGHTVNYVRYILEEEN